MMRKLFLFYTQILVLGITVLKGQPTWGGADPVVESGYALAQAQYTRMLNQYSDVALYPRSADNNGKTSFTDSRDWTGGFWPGSLWYVYEYTGDLKWKEAALRWTHSLENNQYNTHHHDIGFVMNCSYGNAYRLTGDTAYKAILIQSAKSLLTRFNPKVDAIKSWNSFPSWDGKSVYEFPVIIDNMMNLELLFLASKLSGDAQYRDVAIAHAETTLKNHYRDDFSSYHVVNYDPQTGEVLARETAQGFSDNSAWARGQAWGLYGFTLMYKETRDPKYLTAAVEMAEWYRTNKRLPDDKIPYWDFDVDRKGYVPLWDYQPGDFQEIPRDVSAAAITSSALLELAAYVDQEKKDDFEKLAGAILESLSTAKYSSEVGKNGYFILKHSVGSIPHKGEIDVPLVYADYYYLEALKRWQDLRKPAAVERKHSWDKMNQTKQRALQDFQQQKFGMFIHWGLYAIPGGVWNGKTMEEMGSPSVAEWIQLVAKIPREEYAALAASFNPVDFNADHIVSMAKDAGMNYIVITSKHHDGFALFDSKVSAFDIMDATPFKRDIVKELYEACKKHQLEFGIYYSHNIDWADGADAQYATTKAANNLMGEDTDSFGANLWDPSPHSFASYVRDKAIPQVKELLAQYPDIRYIWFDMPGLMTPEQSYAFYKTVYDINPEVIIAERIGNEMGDYAIPGDNRIPDADDQFDKPWEAIGTFNHSWGYKAYDQDWKSMDELLYWLVEIVSKGGNYMLNIGPDAEGNVAPMVMNNLQKLGSWMAVNNEAIYGTKPWKVQREGPTTIRVTDTEQREKEGFKAEFTSEDFWFTQRGNSLYAVSLELPDSREALIKSFGSGEVDVKQVEILGVGKVAFRQTAEGLTIKLPKSVQKLPKGYTLKITQI